MTGKDGRLRVLPVVALSGLPERVSTTEMVPDCGRAGVAMTAGVTVAPRLRVSPYLSPEVELVTSAVVVACSETVMITGPAQVRGSVDPA